VPLARSRLLDDVNRAYTQRLPTRLSVRASASASRAFDAYGLAGLADPPLRRGRPCVRRDRWLELTTREQIAGRKRAVSTSVLTGDFPCDDAHRADAAAQPEMALRPRWPCLVHAPSRSCVCGTVLRANAPRRRAAVVYPRGEPHRARLRRPGVSHCSASRRSKSRGIRGPRTFRHARTGGRRSVRCGPESGSVGACAATMSCTARSIREGRFSSHNPIIMTTRKCAHNRPKSPHHQAYPRVYRKRDRLRGF